MEFALKIERSLRIVRRLLGVGLLVAALLAAAEEPAGTPLRTLEQRILEYVNRRRSEASLAPLRRHSGLDSIARRHSQRMASDKVAFGHTGLDERQAEVERLVSLARLAENLSEHPEAQLEAVPEQAVALWLESPGHRTNLDGSFDLTGIGAAANAEGSVFLTEIFVLTKPEPRAPPATESAD